ncbi:MAG: ATP-dependent RNA helicase RhlE [Candidatus Paceibacteria bacterium]|jgi:ATP-dependent RNA helicase RhlE
MNTTKKRNTQSDSSKTRLSSSSLSTSRGRKFNSESKYGDKKPKSGGGFRGRSGGGGGNKRGGGGKGGRKMPTFDPSMFINTNPVEVKEEVYTPKHKTFADFDINPKLSDIVMKMGIKVPSPIQDQIIPDVLAGKDVIGLAETGTGKTAAFLVPLIQQTMNEKSLQTLILAPTRELALQIEEEFRKIARNLGQYSVTCVGGMNILPQIKRLQRKNHFVIGTPGRILDLIKRGCIKPGNMSAVVLDEADRMLDMGFIHDMKKILSAIPASRQTLFFSATMTPATKQLAHDFLNDPVVVSVKKKDVTDSIAQDVVRYNSSTKFDTLTELFKDKELKKVIIFGAMKHSVEKLSNDLQRNGINATSIHGNKSHGQRQRSLLAFKKGEAQVLVATDVAARGIHVDDVSHVINYDLPQTLEDYVHRIGRTGRATKKGKALTFVSK